MYVAEVNKRASGLQTDHFGIPNIFEIDVPLLFTQKIY